MLVHVLLYGFGFFLIWYGSGLILRTATRFSRQLHISPFVFSFLILGLLTSIPEFSVGLQAVANNHAEIFVGNLLGAVMVLFLMVIPLLAIIGNGIKVTHELSGGSLILTLITTLLPALVILDKTVSLLEGVAMIGMYLLNTILMQRHKGFLDQKNAQAIQLKKYSHHDLLLLVIGLILVFVSSDILLEKTLFFAETLKISAFYIGLIIVSLGTNLPEFVLAMRSALQRRKDVALGDYLGSAATNTLFFGIFTLLNGGEIVTVRNFFGTFSFMVTALIIFYIFSRSKKTISRVEGLMMFGVYLSFLAFEMLTK